MRRKSVNFSLLELIICLGILAVLASILLENFADVKARECEALTASKGNHVRDVMKGRSSPEGISAFLSDMGRFPKVYIPSEGDGNGGRRLAELYDPSIWYCSSSGSALRRQRSLSAADIQDICRSPAGSTLPADSSGIMLPYPEVSMNIGWNGPYINIANPVKGNFFDGWGRSWKIISNYNFSVSGNHLTPNSTVYATAAELNNTPCRIDGIISYGANDASDAGTAEIPAADADQAFLFAHNMDNLSNENTASLTLRLKLRDPQNGQWRSPAPISFWKAGAAYAKGTITVYSNNIYCCVRAHTSGSSFSAADWFNVSSAQDYAPAVHGNGSFSGLCIYDGAFYLRTSANSETGFTAANWMRIASTGEIPDSVSLLIFTPVMQGEQESRIMELGYYHFYRNPGGKNGHGVKPLAGISSPAADVDCTGDTTTVYGENEYYNSRYLIAEDHSPDCWDEFFIKRLIPGHRKIFCMIYSSSRTVCYQSRVEELALKPGSNVVTLCLERKL